MEISLRGRGVRLFAKPITIQQEEGIAAGHGEIHPSRRSVQGLAFLPRPSRRIADDPPEISRKLRFALASRQYPGRARPARSVPRTRLGGVGIPQSGV
jgi:hypothetical protein